ncbi:hypothetical protein BKA63DRAFT_913 [Paraphoma chrysanthemicola]|nr:hypothetical protein BKA63DRAFT_913 [Paraphoma chrysanthemicola]
MKCFAVNLSSLVSGAFAACLYPLRSWVLAGNCSFAIVSTDRSLTFPSLSPYNSICAAHINGASGNSCGEFNISVNCSSKWLSFPASSNIPFTMKTSACSSASSFGIRNGARQYLGSPIAVIPLSRHAVSAPVVHYTRHIECTLTTRSPSAGSRPCRQ